MKPVFNIRKEYPMTVSPMHRLSLAVALSLSALLAACASATSDKPAGSTRVTSAGPGEEAPSVVGDWWVVRVGGQLPVAGSTPLLTFEAALKPKTPLRVSGDTGCNALMGEYRYGGEPKTLTIDRLATTRMACEPALMRQESILLKDLQSAIQALLPGLKPSPTTSPFEPPTLVLRTVDGREVWLKKRERR